VIKAKMSDGSLLFGLSAENCRLLLAGYPITFDLASIGLPPQGVVIVGGETEEAIEAALREANLFSSKTRRINPGQTGN
jgi:hypothetical protein